MRCQVKANLACLYGKPPLLDRSAMQDFEQKLRKSVLSFQSANAMQSN